MNGRSREEQAYLLRWRGPRFKSPQNPLERLLYELDALEAAIEEMTRRVKSGERNDDGSHL